MTAPFMGGMAGDPYESKQDLGELNLWTLIGCTDERGDAWHRVDGLQGAEDNHYPGFIPEEDVRRRLFGWEPRRAEVAYLVPVDAHQVSGYGFVNFDGQSYRIIRTQEDRIGVLRSDNDYDLGVFKSGAQHPPYTETLLERSQRITGSQLGISTAGLLQKGGVAWMEFSLPEALHDAKSGLEYRPNLLIADSMNGTISLTTAATIEATVCMNTLTRNLLEAGGKGLITRRKHTSGIVARDVQDERQALGIVEQVDNGFLAELHQLIDTPVTNKQRIEVLDIMVPLDDDMSERSRKMAENKRDRIMGLSSDPMVEQWVGTAFGELQRYNTDDHWQAPAKGTSKWERNTWRVISGKRAEADREVVRALERVLA